MNSVHCPWQKITGSSVSKPQGKCQSCLHEWIQQTQGGYYIGCLQYNDDLMGPEYKVGVLDGDKILAE